MTMELADGQARRTKRNSIVSTIVHTFITVLWLHVLLQITLAEQVGITMQTNIT